MTLLQTQQLDIGYHAGRRPDAIVARNINLSLDAGELVCLLGPNGCGKSTLLRTIAGMQKPLSGAITLAGHDITRLKPRQLATRLSIVLTDRPDVGLLNGYALVALGRHPHTGWMGRLSRYDEAVIQWAIETVDAGEFATRPVMQLSDGQRQKLLIARALAQETDLILLDEPTAFLDLPRRAEIMYLLRQLAAATGRAILLSTHDLDLALQSADTLWLMGVEGVHAGTPEDMVISGAFEAAFQSEGVAFDRANGAFSVRFSQDTERIIAVHGQGVAHTWTRHALKRTGFTLTHPDTKPPLQVMLHGSDEQPIWDLYQHDQHTIHHSIAELLSTLQEITSEAQLPQRI